MKRCAIFGSMGYIGKHIEWFLRQMGIEPICYDIHNYKAQNYIKIDLTNKDNITNIDFDVDYIFFFAGLTGTDIGFDMYEKFVSVNEIGLLNLLDGVRKSLYRPKIIFPSTRLVYMGIDKPLREDDKKETKTIYAVNKLACEGILHAYKVSFDIPYTVFRICIPYGSMDNNYSYGLIGFFEKMAAAGKDITIYGNGDIKRTFTHVQDICYQTINVAFEEQSVGEIYNIGGETYTIKEVAELIASKYKTNVVSVPWPEKDKRIESSHTYFDDSKIKSFINPISFHELKSTLL